VGQGVVDLGGPEHPEVQLPAALGGGQLQGGVHQGHLHAHAAVLGVDGHLEPEVGAVTRQVGVAHRVGVGRVLGHDAGEALARAVDEIQPLVLAQGGVVVGRLDGVEQVTHLGQVGVGDVAQHPHLDHVPRLPALGPRPVGRWWHLQRWL
jgi:hypothetical protein